MKKLYVQNKIFEQSILNGEVTILQDLAASVHKKQTCIHTNYITNYIQIIQTYNSVLNINMFFLILNSTILECPLFTAHFVYPFDYTHFQMLFT